MVIHLTKVKSTFGCDLRKYFARGLKIPAFAGKTLEDGQGNKNASVLAEAL